MEIDRITWVWVASELIQNETVQQMIFNSEEGAKKFISERTNPGQWFITKHKVHGS